MFLTTTLEKKKPQGFFFSPLQINEDEMQMNEDDERVNSTTAFLSIAHNKHITPFAQHELKSI